MKKRYIIISVVLVVTVIGIIFYSARDTQSQTLIETTVQNGNFEIVVTVTGELKAKNSENITLPLQELRNIRVYEISIGKMVDEGTVVDSGEFVAQLDDSNVRNALKDIEDKIEANNAEIETAKIDSSLDLRSQRDNIVNLRFSLQEAEIALEQSKYESPSVIRKAQIDLDKVQRQLDQALGNYQLKVQQSRVNIRQKMADLNKNLETKQNIMDVLQKLVITAPAPGMVIYQKERNGTKRTVGSSIQLWRDPVVATLPDMSSFNTICYINEIDISKIKPGQEVNVGIDAFPEKKFTGKVVQVANIGEQLPNADAKVFEVEISLNETDPVLRPAMTTSNAIVTKEYTDVNYLPLEAVHSNDSLTFVYRSNKTKQLVVLGEANENEIIVEQGLDAGDAVLLSVPEDADNYKYTGMELASVIKDKMIEEEKQAEKEKELREGNAAQGDSVPRMNRRQNPPNGGFPGRNMD